LRHELRLPAPQVLAKQRAFHPGSMAQGAIGRPRDEGVKNRLQRR